MQLYSICPPLRKWSDRSQLSTNSADTLEPKVISLFLASVEIHRLNTQYLTITKYFDNKRKNSLIANVEIWLYLSIITRAKSDIAGLVLV